MIRLGALLVATLCLASPAMASGGVVFEDRNGDGARQPDEPGVAGIAVARGAVLVETDGDGRYALPDDDSSDLVVLTRPAGYDCERWYRTAPGDFALRSRTPDGSSFVFAHISDVHISDRLSDYAQFVVSDTTMAMPRWLRGVAANLMMRIQNPAYSKPDANRAMRAALSRRSDTSSLSDMSVMGEWLGLLGQMKDDDDVPLIDPVGDFAASLAELRSLAPRFVVSTGDMVLESNDADAAAVDRWMAFYRDRTRATGLRFYDTIGNNEIAGASNPDFVPGDSGYGKALFRAHFGPTHYSFDRGGLHFVALDTQELLDREDEKWSYTSVGEGVRAWIEADLALHAGRPIVVLNHEPLAADPTWPAALRHFATVDAEVRELLEQSGVRWTLSGHLHINGLAWSDGPHATQHVMTGALSGMRWSLPPEVFERGYRLIQLHDGELYSVWKITGHPVVGFVEPNVEPTLYATGPRREPPASSTDRRRVVVAAVDAASPFTTFDLRIAGQPLAVERWSPYFAAAWYDAASLGPGEHALVAELGRSDGSVERIQARVAVAERVKSAR